MSGVEPTRLNPSAHQDTFCRDHLPPADQWPDLVIDLPELRYPQRLVLRFWLAAGDLEDLRPLLPELEEWGRERGATLVEAHGRLGWSREAKANGYRLDAAIYRKEL